MDLPADIKITKLSRIARDGGKIMHVMKSSSFGFSGFGEAYVSWIESGYVKGWKYHTEMTLNLVVPLGEVDFVFFEPKDHSFRKETIGESRYCRLTVPPKIWFGFQGVSDSSSMVLNLANIEHEPNEALQKELSEILFDWRVM